MSFFPRLPRIGLELQGKPLPIEIALADGFFSRLRGLMFAPPLSPGRGLLIAPCHGIHALFMRGEFEAVFLAKDGQVLKIATPLRPWRGLSVCRGAGAVLEWAVGEAASLGVREGARLEWTKWNEQENGR
ncbi:MAG: DUF192 domain-containing protein [Candidatus Accumulibacter sp.]|jgi:uncharacterized membrane protein (UPF0127 family)|nr:DUF192 domain-containing protein [Accumulibacter sp.]